MENISSDDSSSGYRRMLTTVDASDEPSYTNCIHTFVFRLSSLSNCFFLKVFRCVPKDGAAQIRGIEYLLGRVNSFEFEMGLVILVYFIYPTPLLSQTQNCSHGFRVLVEYFEVETTNTILPCEITKSKRKGSCNCSYWSYITKSL